MSATTRAMLALMDGRRQLRAAHRLRQRQVLFGLAPALHAVRGATRDALTEASANTTPGRSQNRLRNALVIGEVALSLILLVGASLFVRSFLKLLHEDDAFKTTGLACVSVEMPEGRDESLDVVGRK